MHQSMTHKLCSSTCMTSTLAIEHTQTLAICQCRLGHVHSCVCVQVLPPPVTSQPTVSQHVTPNSTPSQPTTVVDNTSVAGSSRTKPSIVKRGSSVDDESWMYDHVSDCTQGFIQDFLLGGGRSLWGTATALCMRLYNFCFKIIHISSFLGGGGNSRTPHPLYETLVNFLQTCTGCHCIQDLK